MPRRRHTREREPRSPRERRETGRCRGRKARGRERQARRPIRADRQRGGAHVAERERNELGCPTPKPCGGGTAALLLVGAAQSIGHRAATSDRKER